MYKHLQGGCRGDGARLFPVVPSARTRGHGHTLTHRRVPLDIRKHFLTVRVTERWHRLPREAVVPPSMEMFSTQPDMVLGHLL